jgi:hypothetical protein
MRNPDFRDTALPKSDKEIFWQKQKKLIFFSLQIHFILAWLFFAPPAHLRSLCKISSWILFSPYDVEVKSHFVKNTTTLSDVHTWKTGIKKIGRELPPSHPQIIFLTPLFRTLQ